MRLRDERYLFGLTPWVFFALWLGIGIGLGAGLEDAPLSVRVLVLGPIGWSMPFYMVRMPISSRRRRRVAGLPQPDRFRAVPRRVYPIGRLQGDGRLALYDLDVIALVCRTERGLITPAR